jgi:hypothetical protein
MPLVGGSEIVRRGLPPSRDGWCRAGALWHWGAKAIGGVNPGQAAHTCWERHVVLGYAQDDLGNGVHNILYYRNCGIRHGEHGRVIETWLIGGPWPSDR